MKPGRSYVVGLIVEPRHIGVLASGTSLATHEFRTGS